MRGIPYGMCSTSPWDRFPTIWGSSGDDVVGWEHLKRIPGNENVQYGTKEHEKAARAMYLDTIAEHPWLLVRGVWFRMTQLFWQQLPVVAAGVLASVGMMLAGGRYSRFGVVAMSNIAAGTVVTALVFVWHSFYLDFVALNVLAVIMAFLLAGVRIAEVVRCRAEGHGAPDRV